MTGDCVQGDIIIRSAGAAAPMFIKRKRKLD